MKLQGLSMKKRAFCIVLSFLAAICCIFALSACSKENGKESGEFTLDQTEISLKTDGESKKITLLYNGSPYDGAIAWTVDSAAIATVNFGYVTGLRAGETNVNATVKKQEKDYTVACKVNVISSIAAQTDKIYAYAGSGDIDVSIPSGLLTTGASYSVSDVKNAAGESVKSLYYQSGATHLLKNDASYAMAAGNYQVFYVLTKDGVTDEAVRDVCIKRADSYYDLLIVDPVDGSENISGSAMLYPWTSVADNPKPGEYVKFDSESVADGISAQTRTAFLQSLQSSGYDGYLGAGTAGYDTVYRMYVRKNNKGSTPYPNFFVNLPDTAGNIWGNLDRFPAGTTLSIWARLLVREDGSEGFTPTRINWAYPYKVQNSGLTLYDGFEGGFYAEGGWTNFRMPLSALATNLNDARNLGLCFGSGTSVRGDVYLDLYSVEITALSDCFAPLNKADLSLAGDFSGMFDNYTINIYDEAGSLAWQGNSNDAQAELPNGKYTAEYTLKRGDVELPQKTTRKIYSGVISDLSSLTMVQHSSWGTKNTLSLDKSPAVGVPTGTVVNKTSCVVRTVNDVEGRDMPSFDISAVLSEIDALDDRDYIGVWMYIEKAQLDSYTVSAYLSEGNGDWGSVANGTVIFNDPANPNGWGGTPISDRLIFNDWTCIRVYVSDLRAMLAKRPDLKKIDRLCISLHNMGAANQGYKYYYYSAEFYKYEPISESKVICTADNAGQAVNSMWTTSSRNEIVENEVGKPFNTLKTGDKYIKSSVGYDLDANGNRVKYGDIVGFDIKEVIVGIDDLADEDYLLLRVQFSILPTAVSFYLSEGLQGMDSKTIYKDSTPGFSTNTWSGYPLNCSLKANTWCTVKVTVAQLREMLAKRPELKNINIISFDFSGSQEGAAYYFYSLELIKPGSETPTYPSEIPPADPFVFDKFTDEDFMVE